VLILSKKTMGVIMVWYFDKYSWWA